MKKTYILVTGSKGFIGANLIYTLKNYKNFKVSEYYRSSSKINLINNIKQSDIIIHLACINRPKKNQNFEENLELTKFICKNIPQNKKIKIIFPSTYHLNTNKKKSSLLRDYCIIKRKEEKIITKIFKSTNNKFFIYRLPNIVGKWSKPNYNSVVSTFCYNIANNKKSNILNKNNIIKIVSVESVINSFLNIMNRNYSSGIKYISPNYNISIEKLYNKIQSFNSLGSQHIHGNIEKGLDKILYSAFISYLPNDKIKINLDNKFDNRGSFFELLKTRNSGQLSFFTIRPGIVRGGHYHHMKVEKFFVISGRAEFKFIDIRTKKSFKIRVSSLNPQIIYSKPGYFHKIKNIGKEELISILWSSEIYDSKKSDTYIDYK